MKGFVRCMGRLTFCVAFLSCAAIASSQEVLVPIDSLPSDSRQKLSGFIVPGAFVAVGTAGVYNGWSHQLRNDVRSEMSRLRTSYFHADDYLQYLPVASSLALGRLGAKARHGLPEQTVLVATSYALMGVAVNAMKYAFREPRPDTGSRNSFPSGHTATAFMGAELVNIEYGAAWGAAAYGVATGIAFLRLYNNRHWLNDVVAGAGLGICSARAARLLLPLERKLLGLNQNQQMAIVPAYDFSSGQAAVVLAVAW